MVIAARLVQGVAAGATVAHTPDVKNLLPDLQSYKPTFILAVPRVFEKVYNNSMLKAEDAGKGKIFHAGADTAIAWSKADQAGKVPLGLKVKHAIFDKLLYGKIRTAMGGRVQHAVSGGAPLGEEHEPFRQIADVDPLQRIVGRTGREDFATRGNADYGFVVGAIEPSLSGVWDQAFREIFREARRELGEDADYLEAIRRGA